MFNPTVKHLVNTHQSTLSGDEIIAAVLVSHVGHVPSHAALVDANRMAQPAVPKAVGQSATPRRDSTGEICRLFSIGKCKYGATCKRIHDDMLSF